MAHAIGLSSADISGINRIGLGNLQSPLGTTGLGTLQSPMYAPPAQQNQFMSMVYSALSAPEQLASNLAQQGLQVPQVGLGTLQFPRSSLVQPFIDASGRAIPDPLNRSLGDSLSQFFVDKFDERQGDPFVGFETAREDIQEGQNVADILVGQDPEGTLGGAAAGGILKMLLDALAGVETPPLPEMPRPPGAAVPRPGGTASERGLLEKLLALLQPAGVGAIPTLAQLIAGKKGAPGTPAPTLRL